MGKVKTVFFCGECGADSPQWLGKCPQCGQWNTFTEMKIADENHSRVKKFSCKPNEAKALNSIKPNNNSKISLGSTEFDRIMGGGVYSHTTVLFAGEPGIGKSTLLLQSCARVSDTCGQKVLYVSAEESLEQIKVRSERLGISSDNVYVIAEHDSDAISEAIEKIKPLMVVVDSIQAVFSSTVPSSPGTVTQVREVAMILSQAAKADNFILFLIGHVTKDGTLAGPRALEHLVDVVVYFEGERYQSLRIIRSIKNRYGATGEVGIFEMTEKGLIEVKNPSKTKEKTVKQIHYLPKEVKAEHVLFGLNSFALLYCPLLTTI